MVRGPQVRRVGISQVWLGGRCPRMFGRAEVWARMSGCSVLGGAYHVFGRAKPGRYVESRDAPAGRSDALVRSALARKENKSREVGYMICSWESSLSSWNHCLAGKYGAMTVASAPD
jgi:hypothetical protein